MLLVFIVYEKRSLRIYRLSSKKRGEGEKECPEIRMEKEGGGVHAWSREGLHCPFVTKCV